MINRKILGAFLLCIGGCASIPDSAIDRSGIATVRVTSRTTFEIGGNHYPKEAAEYWLNRLRREHKVLRLTFLIDDSLLRKKIQRDNWLFDSFKGCSEAEASAFLLAHDTFLGNPESIFEVDSRTGIKGKETPCSGYSFTMEM